MAVPNMLAEVEQAKQKYPQAWKDAHTGNAHTDDFILLLAADLHAINPRFGNNGKRGDPNDISDDAINYQGEGADFDPTNHNAPVTVVDVIGGAGGPSPTPQWAEVTNPSAPVGAAWVKPVVGVPPPTPEPEPEPDPIKPYPGDATWDAVGEMLFADYKEAKQAPNPQMGRWFGRTIWDATEGDASGAVLTVEASIQKHRVEWRAALGLP